MTNASRSPESCLHRCDIRSKNDSEVATCALLKVITSISDQSILAVPRDACNACCESYSPSEVDLNPIVASLLYGICEQVIDAGGMDGCDVDEAKRLNQWAEQSLPAVAPDEDDTIDIARLTYDHLCDITSDDIARHLPLGDDEQLAKADKWAVGVTTAPRRLPTLEQCVQSIIKSGWPDPVLFIDGEVDVPESISHLNTCHRKPATGAFPNYILSLMELFMRDPYADAYMIVQDDALFLGAPAVRDYMESVLWPYEGACIASLYCSTKYDQQKNGWYLFPENWIWGAVAFVFSREAVQQLVASPMVPAHRSLPDDEGLSRIDLLIGQFAKANEIPVIFPSPSLVQHIGTISTLWNVARAVNPRRASQFIGDLIRPL